VCKGARNLLGAKFAVLAVNSHSRADAPYVVAAGIELDAQMEAPLLESGPLSKVFRERTTWRTAGDGIEHGLPAGYPRVRSIVAAPVTSLTRTYGWICLMDKVGATEFGADDERMLGTLAAQVGRIYENGSLYLELQNHAASLLMEMEERERAVSGLRTSEEQFRQLAENIQDVFFITSHDFSKQIYVSPAYEKIWGRPLRDATPETWMEAVHPADREAVERDARKISAALPAPGELEYRILRPDGTMRWILSRFFAIVDRGKVVRVVGVARDITERKLSEAKIFHLSRVHAMLSGINSLIVRESDRGELLRNACRLAIDEGRFRIAWCGLLDSEKREVVPAAWAGDNPDASSKIRVKFDAPEDDTMVGAAMRSRQPVICNDLTQPTVRVANREALVDLGYRAAVALPLILAAQPIGCLMLITDEADFFDEDEMRLLTELSGDISFALDHIQKSERINYLALYDTLTDFANRALFVERLTQNVTASQRGNTHLALVVADPEHFATINEKFGRSGGDELLRELAARFARAVGSRNQVARIGADQFAAMIPGLHAAADATRRVDDLWREWLGQPFEIRGEQVMVTAKAGIAMFPGDSVDAETLLRNAEAALKTAKDTANPHAFFTAELSERLSERLTLESSLRRALEEEEFVLHYQPKVDLETRRVQGFEALLRWNSPERGLIPPSKFIPLLEENGMIADVGAWALRQATIDRSRWLEQSHKVPRVAVNVSAVQLRRDDFVRMFVTVLRLAGADPGLDIEVTESLLVEDIEENLAKLTAVKDLGVGIALDDFGTGYSSLGYLAKLPVQSLKIDRSFISTMLEDPGAMTLVSTIISLANTLKLETVAEGVESEEQAKILRLLRCGQMQGYLISKPLSFDEVTTYLKRRRHT